MVDKITLTSVASIDNSLISAINSNNALLTTAIDNTLSRDGTSPNQMGSNLDMNGAQILNLPPPATINSPARLVDVASNPTITVPPVGTSGATVPLLNANNTWSGSNTFNGATSFNPNIDASEINFTNASTGAIARTLDARLKGFWIDVKDYGAVGDDATDNSTAFTNAYNALVAKGGGTLFFPAGIYRCATFPTIININNVNFKGEGAFTGTATGTVLRHTTIAGDFITFNNSQYCTMEDIYFWPTVRKTSGAQISLTNSCAINMFRRIRIDYAYNGFLINDSASTCLEYIQLRYLLGTQGILFTGTAAITSSGLELDHVMTDNPLPVRSISFVDVRTWAQNTAFTAGQAINNNGNVYQCTVSGTSSAVGTGPAGFPAGTSAESVTTTNIVDGTAQWRFVCSSSLTWFVNDNYANSCTAFAVQLLNGAIGVLMQDTANTGTSFPSFLTGFDLSVDHPFIGGYVLNGGYSVFTTGSFIGSCITNNGVSTGANFKGELQITNSRITGNAGQGILLSAGPTNIYISNNTITNNSAGQIGVNQGISIAANASHITAIGNRLGNQSLGGNQQSFGLAVLAGTSDYIVAIGNDCQGNVNGGMFVGAITGTHNVIRDNPGYNPVGATAATTMGASPFTYTAGSSPETHYVKQTATNTATITQGGQQIHALVSGTTFYPIELSPNESYITTWVTTAPTFTKFVH